METAYEPTSTGQPAPSASTTVGSSAQAASALTPSPLVSSVSLPPCAADNSPSWLTLRDLYSRRNLHLYLLRQPPRDQIRRHSALLLLPTPFPLASRRGHTSPPSRQHFSHPSFPASSGLSLSSFPSSWERALSAHGSGLFVSLRLSLCSVPESS
jgi:hypothetical protein